ncbi:MAG: tetratricopeptide repeat protein [Acidobacteria bacterium]|nr:tetratricopeptide repeat protein [Acidobacteriota bacterium]
MRRTAMAILLALSMAGPGFAAGAPPTRGEALPQGLDLFIKARLAEVGGDYKQALDLYKQALKQDPDRTEVRVSYASLLVDLGLASQALDVLAPVKNLDWYGERTRALALAQLARRTTDDQAAAEKALKAALEGRPSDLTVQVSLAQVLENEGKLAEAEQVVADLQSKRSGSPQLALMHADLLRRLGRSQEAVAQYGRCAAAGPLVSTCRERLVDLLVQLGRPLEAADAISGWLTDEDLDMALEAAQLYARGNQPDKALALVRRVLARAPDSPRAQRLEAALLNTLGRYDEAAAKLGTLLRKNPDDVDLTLSLAWADARRGHLDRARQLIDRLWKEVGDDTSSKAAVQTCLTAARIELIAGRPAVARDWLGRITNVAGAGSDLVRLLAVTYRRTQEWKDGVGAMLRLQPRVQGRARDEAVAFEAEFRMRLGEPDAVSRLQRLLSSDDVQRVLLAVQVLQTVERWPDVERETVSALKRFPGNRDLMFVHATALERLGKSAECEDILQQILAKNPDDADAANYLGYMWADAGQHLQEAMKLISHAVELRPDTSAFLDSLGWVHFKLGHLEEAERWLRRAAVVGPPDGTVLAHLGEVLAATGQTDEARRYLQRALDLGCEHPEKVRQLSDRLASGR